MASRTYDDAVGLLNTLQTPRNILQERIANGIRIDQTANDEMRKCLGRIGYTQEDLSKLNVVHVAGTKGKGSTCAFVDSILSRYMKSRGIPKRVDSRPISPEIFAKYFFEIWDKLEHASTVEDIPFEKPVYFRYLTLMSYHAFIQEGVDVAIYEVGVGGEYDSTNIVDHPTVTGISSLGIDHTFSLGTTIESISWHKAGIQKASVPSFSVPQPPSALDVVRSRSSERKVSSFTVVKDDPRLQSVKIKPNELFQHLNASLAIALTETILHKLDPSFSSNEEKLPKEFVDGLEQVIWHGRCETKTQGNITWYLDGAHTDASLEVAAKWFGDEQARCSPKPTSTILIFNQQGHRDCLPLLKTFFYAAESHNIHFSKVVFCPTVSISPLSNQEFANAATDKLALANQSLQKQFATNWIEMEALSKKNAAPNGTSTTEASQSKVQTYVIYARYGLDVQNSVQALLDNLFPKDKKAFAAIPDADVGILFWRAKLTSEQASELKKSAQISSVTVEHDADTFDNDNVIVKESVEAAMQYVRAEAEHSTHVNVLVTGSVHLVGRVLGVMEDEEMGNK